MLMNYVTSHYINNIMRCDIFRQLVDVDKKVIDFAKVTISLCKSVPVQPLC